MTGGDRRPMTYKDVAPNFRCTINRGKTYVEIPAKHEQAMWPPANTTDPEALAIQAEAKTRVAKMVAAHKQTTVFDEPRAEATDDHRAATLGVLVPVEVWDRVMGAEVPGWVWKTVTTDRAGAGP